MCESALGEDQHRESEADYGKQELSDRLQRPRAPRAGEGRTDQRLPAAEEGDDDQRPKRDHRPELGGEHGRRVPPETGKIVDMAQWKPGQKVRVVNRKVTAEDRAKNRYFEHMAGVAGEVQSVYDDGTVAVQADPESLGDVPRGVHRTATLKMREKFSNTISEEQRKSLTKEELEFDTHYVLLVRAEDLEKA